MRVKVQADGFFSDQELAPALVRGGEGSVHRFTDPDLSPMCAKMYHEHRRTDGGEGSRFEKIQALIDMREFAQGIDVAWPFQMIYAEDGETWLGFTMRHCKGFPLEQLCHFQMVEQAHAHWSHADMVNVCLSMLETIEHLHENNVLVGDLNPRNVIVQPGTKRATLIDCDSMHVTTIDRVYPCTVFVPNSVAPEFSVETPLDYRNTVHSEEFSVAILLARMWLLGRHPFSTVIPEHGRPEDFTEAANIKAGRCPLGVGSVAGLPPGPWENLWMAIPKYIQECFVQTFVAGHARPHLRTSITHWRQAFEEYAKELSEGSRINARMLDIAPWRVPVIHHPSHDLPTQQMPTALRNAYPVTMQAQQNGGGTRKVIAGCAVWAVGLPILAFVGKGFGIPGVLIFLVILIVATIMISNRP
ncbi:MAG: hypothetical protein KDB07_10320 [Planctomycetes bacterium]|nr:hypothetical protein [Planctomycetota bacterium]